MENFTKKTKIQNKFECVKEPKTREKNFQSYLRVTKKQGKNGSVFDFHLIMLTDYTKKNNSSPNLLLVSLSRKMLFELKREEQNMVKRKIIAKLGEEMVRELLTVLNKFESPDSGKLFPKSRGVFAGVISETLSAAAREYFWREAVMAEDRKLVNVLIFYKWKMVYCKYKVMLYSSIVPRKVSENFNVKGFFF